MLLPHRCRAVLLHRPSLPLLLLLVAVGALGEPQRPHQRVTGLAQPQWVWKSSRAQQRSPPATASKASFSDIFGGLGRSSSSREAVQGRNSRSQLLSTAAEDPRLSRFIWPSDSSPLPQGKVASSPSDQVALFYTGEDTDEIHYYNQRHRHNQLDVHHPNSPYGLIQDVLPARKSKPATVGQPVAGGLDPEDVWLSDGSLLVLKGGTTPAKEGFDDPWQPLDDYEAPYRQPILAPTPEAALHTSLGPYSGVAVVMPPAPAPASRSPRLGFYPPARALEGRSIAASSFRSSPKLVTVFNQPAAAAAASPARSQFPPISPSTPLRAQAGVAGVAGGGSASPGGWVPSSPSSPVISNFFKVPSSPRFHRHVADKATKPKTEYIITTTPKPAVQTLQQHRQLNEVESMAPVKASRAFQKVIQYPWKSSQLSSGGLGFNNLLSSFHGKAQKADALLTNDNYDFLTAPVVSHESKKPTPAKLTRPAVQYFGPENSRAKKSKLSFSNSLLPKRHKSRPAAAGFQRHTRRPRGGHGRLRKQSIVTIRRPKRRRRK